MTLPDFLTETRHREILFTGHRVSLHHVLGDYGRGMTAEQLADWYPTLGRELIGRVLEFYHANRGAVDAYLAWMDQELARERAARPKVDWEGMRRKAEERKRAGKGG